jgi:hypothetical protein
MPHLDIVFQNIRSNFGIVSGGAGTYVGFDAAVNVFEGNAFGGPVRGGPGYGVAAPSLGWGGSVTAGGGGGASSIFLCESPTYAAYAGWVAPALPAGHIIAGLTPYGALNKLCAAFDGPAGAPPAVAAAVPPVGSFGGAGRVHYLGTGAMFAGAPPAGSDRYAIFFQAEWRYPVLGPGPAGPQVTGVFVHTKNTQACPGTQLAALCRRFPDEIIFGDLNLDLRQPAKAASLAAAVGATHTILALQHGGGYYFTHYAMGGGSSALDFALVPNAFAPNVELWAHRPNPAIATLWTNGSDHCVMMLRITCA